MLYDPKWEIEVKADPFTLVSLIAWLEKQPRRKSYNFFCAGECLVGQWTQSLDPGSLPASAINSDKSAEWYFVFGKLRDMGQFVRIANDGDDRFTFGAALTRARAALARQQS